MWKALIQYNGRWVFEECLRRVWVSNCILRTMMEARILCCWWGSVLEFPPSLWEAQVFILNTTNSKGKCSKCLKEHWNWMAHPPFPFVTFLGAISSCSLERRHHFFMTTHSYCIHMVCECYIFVEGDRQSVWIQHNNMKVWKPDSSGNLFIKGHCRKRQSFKSWPVYMKCHFKLKFGGDILYIPNFLPWKGAHIEFWEIENVH